MRTTTICACCRKVFDIDMSIDIIDKTPVCSHTCETAHRFKDKNAVNASFKPGVVIHLVLTEHWFDETEHNGKRIEYREMSDHWKRLIWDRREVIKKVRFQRGFKKNPPTLFFDVKKIDIGPCPIDGWNGDYYRIYFT